MDKLQQLYNLMIDRKLLTRNISLQQFRGADESQQEALYTLALDNNIITPNAVSPEDWKGAWLEGAERMAEFNQELEEANENVVELQRQEKERALAKDVARPEAVSETTAGVAVAPPIVEAKPKPISQQINEDIAEYSYMSPEEIALKDQEIRDEELQKIQKRNEGFYDDRGLIDSIFSKEKLSQIEGLDIEEFKEFMIDSGRLEEMRDKAERGLYEESKGTFQDPQLAYDIDRYSAIDAFIASKMNKEFSDVYYNKQKENAGVATTLSEEEKPKLKINQEKLKSYIDDEMVVLAEKQRELDAENAELLKRYQDDNLNGGYKIKQGVKKFFRGFDTATMSSTIGLMEALGADTIADALKNQALQEELFKPIDATYGYASGKQVFVDGIEYVVDERGQIYDKSKTLNVTNFLERDKASEIYSKAGKTNKTSGTMSALGMASNLGNVIGDIGWQVLYQAALEVREK